MNEIHFDKDSQCVTLPAVVNVHTLPLLLKKQDWLSYCVGTVDFTQVTHADSATLSLLLTWYGVTQRPITVINLPQTLKTLVGLYQLEPILAAVEKR